jgi:hypothetical protein
MDESALIDARPVPGTTCWIQMDDERDQRRDRHEPPRHPVLCDKQHARDEENGKPGAGEQHAFPIRQRS